MPTAFKGDSLDTASTVVTTTTHSIIATGKSISDPYGCYLVPYSAQNKFTVYPNPTSSVINVHILGNTNQARDIEVKDILGNILIQHQVVSAQNGVIDVSCLQPGIYFVCVDGGVRKFIKE